MDKKSQSPQLIEGLTDLEKIIDEQLSSILEIRKTRPVEDIYLLSSNIGSIKGIHASQRKKLSSFQEKFRSIIQRVAEKIENELFKPLERRINRQEIPLIQKKQAQELIYTDKQIHISLGALKLTFEFFNELNTKIISNLKKAEKRKNSIATQNIIFTNAILVYELTDFLIDYIQSFYIHGFQEILDLYEEMEETFEEIEREQLALQERAKGEEIEGPIRRSVLANVEAKLKSLELIRKEWKNYVERIENLKNNIDPINHKIPSLELIRDNAKSQIKLLQVIAISQIVKSNIASLEGTITAIEEIELIKLTPERVRMLLRY